MKPMEKRPVSDQEPVVIYRAQGELEAQVVKAKLESAGISAILAYDAAAHIYGFTLDGLGEFRVLVAGEDEQAARRVLADKHA